MTRSTILTPRLHQKIKKSGPFDLSAVTSEHPYFSQLLANAFSQLEELPDFSDDKKIAVMSDFSGEHKAARFHTYSFLILAYDKIGPFIEEVKKLRQKHGLLAPYSEFTFKDLRFGPRSRALPEFLTLVDSLIHGAVVTVAIDKQIETVFGLSKKETHLGMKEQLAAMGYGNWEGAIGEKVLRVCHSIALFTALTARDSQRLLWYCDTDSINENTAQRCFADTQKIFVHALSMYSKHKLNLVGFGKSFDGKSHLDDLLSIADLAAGIVQDLLQAHKTAATTIHGGEEKVELLKWIATQSKFLSKVTVQIGRLPSGELASGVVNFTPAR